MSGEAALREELCALGRSLHARALTHGSTGNLSARCGDAWLLTPTGSNLGADLGRHCIAHLGGERLNVVVVGVIKFWVALPE